MKTGKIAVVALMALMVSGCGSEDNVQSVTETVSNEAVSETNMVTEETDEESNLLAHDTAGTNSENNELSFPLGQAINSDAFTGTAYIEAMINYDDIYNFPQTNNIIFEPGARSSWHTHGGMIILGTGGVGYYQEEGKPAQIIREGDVIEIPEGLDIGMEQPRKVGFPKWLFMIPTMQEQMTILQNRLPMKCMKTWRQKSMQAER